MPGRKSARESFRALKNPDPEIRQAAKEHLKVVGGAVLDDLVAMMETQLGTECVDAAEILRDLGDARACTPMAKMLTAQHPLLGHIALDALTEIHPPDFTDLVLNALPHGNPLLQLAMIKQIGKYGDCSALEPLRNLLLATGSATVRYTIIHALGNLGCVEAIPVIASFQGDPDHHVRDHVQHALQILNAGNPDRS